MSRDRWTTDREPFPGLDTGEESPTRQSDRDAADVNKIMAKYVQTGLVGHLNPTPARYGDFSGSSDYLEAFGKIEAGQAAFATLPSDVRDHVGNDLGEYLALITDPERRNELEDLGLVEVPPGRPDPPAEPPVAEPAAPEAPSGAEGTAQPST